MASGTMTDVDFATYLLAHMSHIGSVFAWCGGVILAIFGALFGVLAKFGKGWAKRFLEHQADLLGEVKAIKTNCVETNHAIVAIVADVSHLKTDTASNRESIDNLRAIVTLTDVYRPEVERIHEKIDDQKKRIDQVISVNDKHAEQITYLMSTVAQESTTVRHIRGN